MDKANTIRLLPTMQRRLIEKYQAIQEAQQAFDEELNLIKDLLADIGTPVGEGYVLRDVRVGFVLADKTGGQDLAVSSA